MKVLFLGGGRRVELARRFIGHGCEVIGYDLDINMPLAKVAKVVKGVGWDDPKVIQHIKQVVFTEDIALLVPLDCRAIGIAGQIGGVGVVAPTPDCANICLNKAEFERVCLEKIPHLYPTPILGQASIYKPVCGFGSRGIRYNSCTELLPQTGMVEQLRMDGPEYSVDAYVDLRGKFIGASVRERLRVSGGEVLDSITVDKPDLVEATKEVLVAVGLTGPACVQFMYHNTPKVIECNARLGGGATLSCYAGFDLVRLIINEYLLEAELKPRQAKPGVIMRRYFKDTFHESGI